MQLLVDIQKQLPDFTLDVSFTTNNPTLGILGASGSGKSMTLRCIAGLDTPTRGRIVLNNRVLFDSQQGINLPSRKRNIGFLFQNYALFPQMTVQQNICFGLKKLPKKEIARRLEEKISMVQLEGLENRYPFQLSGGQQQRVALARALAIEPELILLDEPFSALDKHLQSQMEKQLIETLSSHNGITLFVSHNLEEVYRISQELLIMSGGKIIALGPKENTFRNPPNFTAAQLTGCKNLSRAKALSDNLVEAIDWGCTLKVAQPIPAGLTYIGIRAHHLSLVSNDILTNTFPCSVARTNESPHLMTLYLKLNNYSSDTINHHLQGEVFKEQWENLVRTSSSLFVHLNPESLFLCTE